MAIRPLLDGHTELDPDEPAVPVTGLAFLCQQFVLLLRQRALDGETPAIGLEQATEKLCARVRSNDDKTVLRRLYDVINVLESIDLLERSSAVKRGVQWKGPPLTEVALPPGTHGERGVGVRARGYRGSRLLCGRAPTMR